LRFILCCPLKETKNSPINFSCVAALDDDHKDGHMCWILNKTLDIQSIAVLMIITRQKSILLTAQYHTQRLIHTRRNKRKIHAKIKLSECSKG
jgi:hypothetical protein